MTKFEDNLSPYLTFAEQASTPSTPATGYALFYRKTDNLWYVLDDAGTETAIGSAADLAAHIADTTSAHTAAGIDIVDAGAYLTATNVEAALQEAMAEVDANTALAHAENHASRHSDGGADEVTVENLATAAVDTAYALKPDGLGGVAFGAVSAGGALDDLSDVDTDKSKTPADGDVLTYDGTDWNAEAATGGGSGLSTGTTFPGSPSTGDRYRRSDLDYGIYFYDGTRWLSEETRTASVGAGYRINTSSDGHVDINGLMFNPWGDTDVWAYLNWTGLINGTSDGSNYWTLALRHYSGTWQDLSGGPSVTTANAPPSLVAHSETGSGAVIPSGTGETGFRWDKTGSPGGIYGTVGMTMRKIAT
jgi:hypothetical protein